jgi:Mn-dependent DtxR family transcriptional regulator
MGKCAVFRVTTLFMKPTDKMTLDLLRDNTDPETGRCVMQIKHIARELSVSEPTVYRTTERLQAQGFIRKHHTHGRSGADIEVLSPE